MHYSVMLGESLEYLAIRPDGIYLDATAGLGGHTRAIAQRLTTGYVIAADRDADSLERAKQNTADLADRIRFIHTPFSGLAVVLSELALSVGGETATARTGAAQPAPVPELTGRKLDGLLADLGVSRYQLTDAERGFSLMHEGPLDMRMDRSQETSAAEIVNFTAEKALADLIYQLGEERRARRIARAIVRSRPIRSTAHLAQVIEAAVPRTGRLHPATLTFMALRLAVNDEQGELDALLADAPGMVASGGRVVVISFMSLEDRKVKQAMQAWRRDGIATILTKHVITPSEQESAENPASRSAKLRAAEMMAG